MEVALAILCRGLDVQVVDGWLGAWCEVCRHRPASSLLFDLRCKVGAPQTDEPTKSVVRDVPATNPLIDGPLGETKDSSGFFGAHEVAGESRGCHWHCVVCHRDGDEGITSYVRASRKGTRGPLLWIA